MGVYIKDMEMPISCGDCPCGSVFFGYKCMAEHKEFEKYPLDSRQDWCPLVPVQPHGRLIDADAAAKQGWTISRTYSVSPNQMVYEVKVMTDEILPTVIPAEEGET